MRWMDSIHFLFMNYLLIVHIFISFLHLPGKLCPASHPFPCQGGKKCSSSPWKPTSGNETDCDGTQIGPESLCCPPQSIDCSTAPEFTCKPNPLYGMGAIPPSFYLWRSHAGPWISSI